VSPDYFRVMGVRLLQGRVFMPADTQAVMDMDARISRFRETGAQPMAVSLVPVLADRKPCSPQAPPCTITVRVFSDPEKSGNVEPVTNYSLFDAGKGAGTVWLPSANATAAIPKPRLGSMYLAK
jgi:hypothetical protein